MQPTVQSAVVLKARIANHKHLDGRIVKVGVVGVSIPCAASQHVDVEDLVIDAGKSRAEGERGNLPK